MALAIKNAIDKNKKFMAIVEFKDQHYELVDQLYTDSETEKIKFTVNGEVYMYDPNYFEPEHASKCCGIRVYLKDPNHMFLKRDKFIGEFFTTGNIIRLLTAETDEGVQELEYMLRTTEEKREEKNEMKDILDIVNKIEELLRKSKFEWFMAYDPKEKAWSFQIKEK